MSWRILGELVGRWDFGQVVLSVCVREFCFCFFCACFFLVVMQGMRTYTRAIILDGG